ncbi:MAG TPA: electron transfer flavoprotein subunit alpha/FixB family protein [Oculatellaceae cyanobacterium]
MAQGIVVFIEQRKGQLRKSSLEALSEARRQAKDEPVVAAIVGDNVKDFAPQVAKYGADTVYALENAALAEYSTEGYAAALAEAVKKADPKYVFAANTSMAKDLIPRVAARLDAPCVTDAMELREDGGKLLAVKPTYSGKTLALFEFDSPIAFITLRPNVFAATESAKAGALEVVSVSLGDLKAKVVETHAAAGQKVELSEAAVIVSGGRGIKGPENWPILQGLCDALGAALGASRAVVDAGWIDHQHQVGQTGKTVSPQLYIACGISGAIQHLAGMSSSKVIVAINKDPEAPIFKFANYAVVGDVIEIVPKVTEEVRRLHENN